MTNKQQKFADEYLIDCNATRAYKAAYPGVKNDNVAAVNGYRLLRNANISEYIEKRLEEISNEKISDTIEILEYLTKVLRGETLVPVVVIEFIGKGKSRAKLFYKGPSEMERLRAAELIGKIYGLWKGPIAIESKVIIVNDMPEDW